MKITGIKIDDYRQFNDIEFDFTYPEDHAKAGQPLEKVCFIGQSGTGKTTLLNILWNFFAIVDDGYQIIMRHQLNRHMSDEPYNVFEKISVKAKVFDQTIEFKKAVHENTDESVDTQSTISQSVEWMKLNGIFDYVMSQEKLCTYIDDAIIDKAHALTASKEESDLYNQPYITDSNNIFIANEKREEALERIKRSKVLSARYIDGRYLWGYLLSDIDNYNENLRKIAFDLVSKSNSFSPERLSEKLNEWQKNNPNPKIDVAENCLNEILKNFFLEVDTSGTEAPIVIRTRAGKQLTFGGLSTGTKQVIVTSIPIYKSKIESGVILVDEPERSLFPDIQRELVKYYNKLSPKAQFFYATHSPIIASAFEPCERFILYFEEDGQVRFHRGIAPEGDDPNDILRQDFDISELMLEKGIKEYQRYRRLGMQIREETDEEKKNQLIAERLELGNRYNFAGRNA